MSPRPIIGEEYNRTGFAFTVQAVDDLHVVATCPQCVPGSHPCMAGGHVFSREEFAERFDGFGKFRREAA